MPYKLPLVCPEHYARILWRDIGHKALCPISPEPPFSLLLVESSGISFDFLHAGGDPSVWEKANTHHWDDDDEVGGVQARVC